uniref:Uncharacterized protein n=1 Tax=Oryza brachyantha TaxID=4533 RepID=J3LXS6_ORYBR
MCLTYLCARIGYEMQVTSTPKWALSLYMLVFHDRNVQICGQMSTHGALRSRIAVDGPSSSKATSQPPIC